MVIKIDPMYRRTVPLMGPWGGERTRHIGVTLSTKKDVSPALAQFPLFFQKT